jgi:hypothetical protein
VTEVGAAHRTARAIEVNRPYLLNAQRGVIASDEKKTFETFRPFPLAPGEQIHPQQKIKNYENSKLKKSY